MHLHTIYTVKSDGRKKARTVLGAGKDKLDTLDLGYERSFSLTARNVTVRLHCAYAAARGLTIRGGNVTQAFSQGDWPDHVKRVYTRACLTDTTPIAYYNGVFHCCEVGNLYGHPIAGRNWYMALCHRMKYYGYEQSAHDPCLFHKYEGGAMSRRRVPAHGPLHGRHPHFCAQGLLALQRLEGVVRQGVHVDRL